MSGGSSMQDEFVDRVSGQFGGPGLCWLLLLHHAERPLHNPATVQHSETTDILRLFSGAFSSIPTITPGAPSRLHVSTAM